MGDKAIGVEIEGRSAAAELESIREAEALGIQAVWLGSGPSWRDPLALYAAAAAQTSRIKLGTAIVPISPRHPLAIAQQVRVLAELAPGRFRLGVGAGTPESEERAYGSSLHAPLGHLREYVQVLKTLFQEGQVDFQGRYYQARARLPTPLDVPVMVAALGRGAFELCGAHADGAITGICPAPYVQEVGLPAMRAAAERAGRPAPPLVFHALICVHDDPQAVRDAVPQQFGWGVMPRTRLFGSMFAAAGFTEAQDGWSDAMIEAVVASGDEARVAERLRELLSWGPDELMLWIITAGEDRDASRRRTLALVGEVARSLE
jgi:F420-dependent oxidoreductase-like protein